MRKFRPRATPDRFGQALRSDGMGLVAAATHVPADIDIVLWRCLLGYGAFTAAVNNRIVVDRVTHDSVSLPPRGSRR